jgi:hypothetical protein
MTATQDAFGLTSDLAGHSLGAAPCLAICGNCKHYEPYRDSQTGREHPSKQGRCGWKPNINWPMAYRRKGYGWGEQVPLLYPVGVWPDTDASSCACFSPNETSSPTAARKVTINDINCLIHE